MQSVQKTTVVRQRFRLGDLICDERRAGRVVGIREMADGGDELYTIADSEGCCCSMLGSEAKAIIFNHSPSKWAARASSHVVGGVEDASVGEAAAAACNDLSFYLGQLSDLMKARAMPGSGVARAFAALDREYNETGKSKERTEWEAWGAWIAMDETIRRRILNGWRPLDSIPTVEKAREGMEELTSHESAARALVIDGMEGEIAAAPEMVLTHGLTTPVLIRILEGTSKALAVSILEAALREVEENFEQLIDMVGNDLWVFKIEAKDSPRKAAKKKPHTSSSPAHKLGSKSGKTASAAA